MGEYVLLYLVAFMLSVFLVPVVRRLALAVGAVDVPDRVRKIHTHTVPRMGGVAIFIAFIVPVVAAYVVGAIWFPTSRVYGTFQEHFAELVGLVGASVLILFVGIYDDIHQVRPRVKVAVQVVAALVLCWVGIRIDQIGNPFTGNMIKFGWTAWPLTVFWVLAITNAINLIDGMDGLGPGVGLFVAGTMFLLSLIYPVPLVTAVMAALVGAIIGFLIFNFHPAKIFMGDSGSLFIGFILSAIAIQGSIKRHTVVALMFPIVVLGLPIIDTLMAIARRWSKGLPMSVPDRQHVHHRLIKMGLSQREAVLVLYGVSVILGCAALVMAVVATGALPVAIAGVTILAVIAAVHLLGGREFSAIGTRIVGVWRRRRSRRRAWVQVYQTAGRMETASSVEQMWEDVGELLTVLGVDMAQASLTEDGSGVQVLKWTRPGEGPMLADGGLMHEGWTARLPLEENGHVCGELVLGKDTRLGALPDSLPGMVEVLRAEMVKTLERLKAATAEARREDVSADGTSPPGT
ncbi:MAG TPA: MraY family glycosyltransferase [Planctomycetota bacterium]|nr:MraY family glycosyltransferase [Planctomycetota bacterium]